MKFRTDLAIERKEIIEKEDGGNIEYEGVTCEQFSYGEDVRCTRIRILNEAGAKKYDKPPGSYITLEVDGLIDEAEGVKEQTESALAAELSRLVHFHYKLKTLVVGLGNDSVTPDALGPATVSKVRVTRHLFNLFGADGDDELSNVSCIIPGVTGMTGIETADIICKAVEITKPDVVIIVDALASRSIKRVSTTIQINDTGIEPGSGMGNMRKVLNEKTLGCKVISIGVPTVIDAATIIEEALSEHIHDAEEIEEYIQGHHQELIVTSTDIDTLIKDFSDIISNGINKTLHPGIYS